jgi:hypothetical protein
LVPKVFAAGASMYACEVDIGDSNKVVDEVWWVSKILDRLQVKALSKWSGECPEGWLSIVVSSVEEVDGCTEGHTKEHTKEHTGWVSGG